MDKNTIVISGVNLVDGGPLSVFLDLLDALVEKGYSEKNRIIVLVGKKELFNKYEEKIEIIEYRNAKKSWFNRIYLEYVGFNKFSKTLNVDIWLSMHDTTPNIRAKHRYVYCHNPSPFNNMKMNEAKFGLKYYLFSKFYKYLYRINIKKNDAVIVQQDWMRREFKKNYCLENVIVARPSVPSIEKFEDKSKTDSYVFVFPSFPRYYKNFQIACEAAELLVNEGIDNFKLYITLSGEENKYARWLKKKYEKVEKIQFCGLLSRKQLFNLYEESNCMIFMSKLETWGMPITEYEFTGKNMIVSDLPYAHETVGDYRKVAFVNPDDSTMLANMMRRAIKGVTFDFKCDCPIAEEPLADNWYELIQMLVREG